MARGDNPAVAVLLQVLPAALRPYFDGEYVVIAWGGHTARLDPIWAGEGFPRDIKTVLGSLEGSRGETRAGGDVPVPVIIARAVSASAMPLLAAAGVNWADAAGHAEIETPPVFVSRRAPARVPIAHHGPLRWSASRSAVAEYLLCRRLQAIPQSLDAIEVGPIATIADEVGYSAGQVAKVLSEFDRAGYTTKVGADRGPTSTREFRDPGGLLSEWAGHYRRHHGKERRAALHVLDRDPTVWDRLAAARLQGLPWAMSGWAAADAVAPFVTTVPGVTLYVPEGAFDDALFRLTADVDVTQVDRGSRIILRSADEYVFTFAIAIGQRRVVSPIRVYADLLRIGGRGAEAAEHLREAAIGF